jgi:hypothetical protein
VDTILRRLFWEEKLLRFRAAAGRHGPRFACTCSRERVGNMLRSLGRKRLESILAERDDVEVGCEFCGQQYRFDAVDRAEDVLLLIEVADSSARYDREVKLPLYARHGVAHVWLVDLEAGRGRLRFYSRLEGGEYSDISSTEHPGVTPLPGLKGMAIDLSGLLG